MIFPMRAPGCTPRRSARFTSSIPDTGVEMLAPDFSGNSDYLGQIFETEPEVFAHNVETVPRIFRRIRPGFRYERSLDVLRASRCRRPGHQVQPDSRHG